MPEPDKLLRLKRKMLGSCLDELEQMMIHYLPLEVLAVDEIANDRKEVKLRAHELLSELSKTIGFATAEPYSCIMHGWWRKGVQEGPPKGILPFYGQYREDGGDA